MYGILDTGNTFTGRISMISINSKEYWQSDPLPNFYSEEKEKNK